MRICIIYNNLGPYHYARLNAFGNLVKNLLVIEVSDRSKTHDWYLKKEKNNFSKEKLFSEDFFEHISPNFIRIRIRETLERYKPDLIITAGYNDPAAQAAVKWARDNSIKSILMMDSWEGDKNRWWLKEKAKKWYVQRFFDSAFVGGWRHYLYALSMGFKPINIWRGVDVVDNDFFNINSKKIRENDDFFRKQYKLPDRYFICVARHSPEKNLKCLLKAYSFYREHNKKWWLILVGDGPQRQELEAEVRRLKLDFVLFAGWIRYEELPVYYGLANAFILPSISETWGLVVNEAMASGLPILISQKCGALPELCYRGLNGYDFSPFNIKEMAGAMSLISSSNESCKKMGRASEEIISSFTPESWARILVSCIDSLKYREF
jgi:glycosyltransferase involved in cell wall biosynthesis